MGLNCLPAEQVDIGSMIDHYSAKRIQGEVKRGLDLLVAALLLLLLSPLFCLIALLVHWQDDGTAIYKRRVVGPRGEFHAYKFRTMRMDADQMLDADPHLKVVFEQNFKLANDPRVTKLGAFLRKYSIDELPQLINVLRGEMSLVGPRMVTAAELGKYGIFREVMLKVKPGMTGYWQVNGRQKVSYEERIRMDVDYIRSWNVLLDLYILCKTPLKVIKGEGAY
jgi:lipopolysaccharide/colanic/teichoic acid biosynthesis glycosyltransferase